MKEQDDTVVAVTESLIESGKTRLGGWKQEQLRILGEGDRWPPLRGWRKRSVGKMISLKDAARFVRLGSDREPGRLIGGYGE